MPRAAARIFSPIVILLWMSALFAQPEACADELTLKSGLRLEGDLVPVQGLTGDLIRKSQGNVVNYPIWMVHTGMQRIFVPNRQIAERQQVAQLSRWETFKLPPHKRQPRQAMLAQVGSFADVTEFDEFGRRRVTLSTPKGPLHVMQGITEIDPRYAKVEGLTHLWDSGLATSSFPPNVLDAILRKATRQENPEDRLAIARFYIQAEMYWRADAELAEIREQFPDLKERVAETQLTLRTELGRQILNEVRRRKASGQYQLAWAATQQFPTENISASLLREVQELESELLQMRETYDRVLMRLSDLHAELTSPELVDAVRPLRSVLRERLDYESLGRLEAFLQLEGDATLRAEQKLALAYSGWVAGSANAVTDLELTIRLWQAQFLMMESLRSDDPRRQESIAEELRLLEGVTPERVGQMVPYLPSVLETPNLQAAVPMELEAAGETRSDTPTQYLALLPPEYSPHHAYPLIVALRPAEVTREGVLEWWGGTVQQPGYSQRYGAIVIVPDYSDLKAGKYDHDVESHRAVLAALRDARRRFNIDSDRVFLTGHGAGGDAAYDIGMSHPDLFAGVIPINGLCEDQCQRYWPNARHLAFYVVSGELARGSLANQDHATTLNRMMAHGGYDIIYSEYIGRGYESYFSELPRLFDWMALHRRARLPQELAMKTVRPTDDHFYWVTVEGLAPSTLSGTPMDVDFKIADGHKDYTALYVRSGAKRNTLWLSPELVSFDKRLIVNAGGSRKFNGFPERKVAVLLDDLRARGDRQNLVWDRIDVN